MLIAAICLLASQNCIPWCSFSWRRDGSFSSHITVHFLDLLFISLRMLGLVLLRGTKSFETLCLPRLPSFTAFRTSVELKLRLAARSSRHTATAFFPWYETPVRIVCSTCEQSTNIQLTDLATKVILVKRNLLYKFRYQHQPCIDRLLQYGFEPIQPLL